MAHCGPDPGRPNVTRISPAPGGLRKPTSSLRPLAAGGILNRCSAQASTSCSRKSEPTRWEGLLLRLCQSPALGYASVFYDVNHLCALDGGDPVGDQQNRRPALQLFDRVQDSFLVVEVETAGRLVKNEQPGLAQQGASQRDALPLPMGQKHSAVAHGRIQPCGNQRRTRRRPG
jgi:hypothetical protein